MNVMEVGGLYLSGSEEKGSAVVNTEMNFDFDKIWGFPWPAVDLFLGAFAKFAKDRY